METGKMPKLSPQLTAEELEGFQLQSVVSSFQKIKNFVILVPPEFRFYG